MHKLIYDDTVHNDQAFMKMKCTSVLIHHFMVCLLNFTKLYDMELVQELSFHGCTFLIMSLLLASGKCLMDFK